MQSGRDGEKQEYQIVNSQHDRSDSSIWWIKMKIPLGIGKMKASGWENSTKAEDVKKGDSQYSLPQTPNKHKINCPTLLICSYLGKCSRSHRIHEDQLSKAYPLSSTGKSHQVEELEVLLMEKETSQIRDGNTQPLQSLISASRTFTEKIQKADHAF